MSSAIRTRGLGFSYGTFRLQDVCLDIAEGSFVCIAGPNGSGKSTLARLLASILTPSGGCVETAGRTGLVLQNPDNQFVSEIVEDDVAFGPENLGHESSTIRREVDNALEQVQMLCHAKRPVSELSYGQKQRIGLAGLLALDPKVLVLDEVMSMMDNQARRETLRLIENLKERGCAVILITHNMEDAVFSDRLILLRNGKVVADGKPADILYDPVAVNGCSLELPFAVSVVQKLEREGVFLGHDILTYKDLERRVRAYLLQN